MPIVPQNTPTRSRINPLPGVSTVNPQGAEGLGSVAGAVGRQADTIGERVNVIGREGQAIQNVIGAVGQDAMTVERIQRIREAKQVDEAMAKLKTDASTTVFSHVDAATNQHVPGTIDAPYRPKTDGSEPSGASYATAQFRKAWMEDKEGPFSKLSPRAQEAFKSQADELFRPIMEHAANRDAESYLIGSKKLDEAATQASMSLVNKTAGNTTGEWDGMLFVQANQEAMRRTRFGQVNIENTDPDKIIWRDKAFIANFEQERKAFIDKATAIRVDTLLQQADAIPVGTPEADAQAKTLLDFNQAFIKDNPNLTPDQVAKAQAMAQQVTAARIQRANALEAQTEKAQDEAIVNFASGRDTDFAHLKPFFDNASPVRKIVMTQALAEHKEAIEIKDIDAGYNRLYLSNHAPADVSAFKTLIAGTQSTNARARGQKLLDDLTAGIQKGEDKTTRLLSNAQLSAGLIDDGKGNVVPASEKMQIDYANKLLREGKITGEDHAAKMKDIASGKSEKQARVAARSLAVVSTLMNIKNPEKFYIFKDGQFTRTPEGMKTERKWGTWEDPVIPGLYRPGLVTKDAARGTVNWGEGGIREKYDALKELASHPVRNAFFGIAGMHVTIPTAINALTAKTTELSSELVLQALNAAVEWEMLPDSGKPTTLEEHVANALSPEKNGTVKEFNAKVFELHMLEHEGMVSDLLNAQNKKAYDALAEGTKKGRNQ